MTKYLMYQGIPFDGDTPQQMFWDVCPIKVVAQADYGALIMLPEKERNAVIRDLRAAMRSSQSDAATNP